MGKNVAAATALAYLSVAVFTFGHCAASSERKFASDLASCRQDKVKFCEVSLSPPGMDGLAAAIVWPLYWSWELQS